LPSRNRLCNSVSAILRSRVRPSRRASASTNSS
jgi:hypothetical protein